MTTEKAKPDVSLEGDIQHLNMSDSRSIQSKPSPPVFSVKGITLKSNDTITIDFTKPHYEDGKLTWTQLLPIELEHNEFLEFIKTAHDFFCKDR